VSLPLDALVSVLRILAPQPAPLIAIGTAAGIREL
jgi:hypothetical protein